MGEGVGARYRQVRAGTEELVASLSPEDSCAQAMPDASPAKWHLAHTTWFFETFILGTQVSGYRPHRAEFRTLFNSYYETVGDRPPRPERGLITRPSLAEVMNYRRSIDRAMIPLVEEAGETLSSVLDLGLAHEEQHQELILTDILALFARNPLEPSVWDKGVSLPTMPTKNWISRPGGQVSIGYDGVGFSFDNERPRHPTLLRPFRIAGSPVTVSDYLHFMADGGYRRPLLWQEEGWEEVCRRRWQAPEYWSFQEGRWTIMTLAGRRPVDMTTPVCHLSWWEADAYARWAGRRLPSEEEWEDASENLQTGVVWEWTASPHRPYPGWRSPEGAMGEYNGKFMAGRFVLRGGSWATPPGHCRKTYRNFFPPGARWQFSGLRLAEDA